MRQFVAENGGIRKSAAILGVSPALVCRVRSGERKVSPELALRLERATGGRIRKESLIWGAAA